MATAMVQLFFRASASAGSAAFFAASVEMGAPEGLGICAFADAAQKRIVRAARKFKTNREDMASSPGLVSVICRAGALCRPPRNRGGLYSSGCGRCAAACDMEWRGRRCAPFARHIGPRRGFSIPGRNDMFLDMRKLVLILVICTFVAAAREKAAKPAPHIPDLGELNAMAARFAPAPMRVDISGLSAGDRKALETLVEAAKIVNTIFMEQVWSGDLA